MNDTEFIRTFIESIGDGSMDAHFEQAVELGKLTRDEADNFIAMFRNQARMIKKTDSIIEVNFPR